MKMKYMIPKIPLMLRFVIFTIVVCTGVWYQFYYPGGTWWIGCLLILVGGFFVIAKDFFNKPLDLGFEDWQPATKEEFKKINDNLKLTKKAKYPFYFRKPFGISVVSALLLMLLLIRIMDDSPDYNIMLAIFDSALIAGPVLIGGSIKLWMPGDLKLKMERFDTIMEECLKSGDKLIIAPYIRLDKDKEGRQIPEDIRLLVEPRRKPDELIGVQVQVAINNGPNGAVPYMYAVFLCKGRGKLFEYFGSQDYENMIKEPGGDKDYGYVVVRQPTGGSGYHTDNNDCLKLFGIIKKRLELPA
jgi:hypothetical protein